MRDDYPVYGTQGGGLARNVNGVFIFIEKPPGQPALDVGDDVPSEWDMVPANQKARNEIEYNIKDEMTVTITLSEPYLNILRKWASVSRTLNTAKGACEIAAYKSNDESDKERLRWCEKELTTIEPALNYLHHVVRNEIWKEDAK
jgi:hypothetical protein